MPEISQEEIDKLVRDDRLVEGLERAFILCQNLSRRSDIQFITKTERRILIECLNEQGLTISEIK